MEHKNLTTRRSFIQTIGLGSFSLLVPFQVQAGKNKKRVSFGVCTDVHQDLMPGVEDRLNNFIQEMERQDVDFIIQLGDFCFPKKGNQPFLDIWNSFSGPRYHVLGNHDMDIASKKEVMRFWGMEKGYYSFDMGVYHFVVLDLNFLKTEDGYQDYARANFYVDAQTRCYLPPDQLVWLEKDLEATSKCVIVFSHQSLEHPRACKNQDQVRALFEKINKRAGYQKVVACFSGHDHTDYHREINGIHYVQINSMTYQWLGNEYSDHHRFGPSEYKNYPMLDKIAPYDRALYATVTVKPGKMQIFGVEGKFVPPNPITVQGVPENLHDVPLKPVISDRLIRW